jgi:RNA polymerase-associated protein RTF1
MLEKRKQLQTTSGTTASVNISIERSRLQRARELAQAREDWVEVDSLTAQLARLPAPASSSSAPDNGNANGNGAGAGEKSKEDEMRDRLAQVNERNRKVMAEAVRRQEIAEMERKKARRLEAGRKSTPVLGGPGTR